MTQKILCFGNEYVEEDALAQIIAKELMIDGIEFIRCEDPDDAVMHGKDIIILDVMKDIDKIKIIEDITKLKTQKISSSHDIDLCFHLKLFKEIGELNSIKIIALPYQYGIEKSKQELRKILPL